MTPEERQLLAKWSIEFDTFFVPAGSALVYILRRADQDLYRFDKHLLKQMLVTIYLRQRNGRTISHHCERHVYTWLALVMNDFKASHRSNTLCTLAAML